MSNPEEPQKPEDLLEDMPGEAKVNDNVVNHPEDTDTDGGTPRLDTEYPDEDTPITPNFESIPDELKDRDQWLCWREEERDGEKTKIPVNPRKGQGFASTTDPDTWASFDTAQLYYESNSDVDGVGFVFSESDTICGVDLDHCRDPETGDIDDWARDIVDRLDTYTEVSVSGTGLHVLVHGIIPEGGNRKGDVEMYGKARYFTITGETGFGGDTKPVERRQDALKDVHNDYVVDDEEIDEDTETSDSDPVDLDLDDEEIIEKAKNAENGDEFASLWNGSTSGYPSQSEADMALACHLAFWTGGDRHKIDELFRESGLMRDKWDEDRGSQTYGELTIDNALKEVNTYYDPERHDGEAGKVAGDAFDPDDEPDQETPDWVGLDARDGGYGYWCTNEDDERRFRELSNFLIETRAKVKHAERDTHHFKLRVKPKNGEPYNVDVRPKVFNRSDKFEDKIVREFSTRWDGDKEDRNDLKEILAYQKEETQKGTHLMGLHGDEFVTPQGTISSDGWSDTPETVFLERETDIERRCGITPETDVDEDDLEAVLRLLPQIRDSERFLSVIGWFYASALNPKFLDWVGEFPLLSITGDTGSGKTSTLQVLWRAFGMDDDPLSSEMTPHGMLTSFSSSNSIPVWFDEYRPADISDRRIDTFHDYCRKTTRGGSEAKGRPDGSTETYKIKAPVVVTGEQQFQDPSLVRRSLLTHFRPDVSEDGTETQKRYAELVGESFENEDGDIEYPSPKDLEGHGVAYYRWILAQDDDELKEIWRECRPEVEDLLEKHGIGGIGNSERTALQVSLFGLRIYEEFAEEHDVDVPIDAGNVDEDVEDALVHVAGNIGDLKAGRRRSHLDDFVEMLGHASMSGYLEEDEHYTLLRGGEVLRFNLSRCYSKVRKYHRDHNLNNALFEKNEYLDRFRDSKDRDDTYVERVGIPTSPINRSVGIYLDEAGEKVDVSLSMFDEGDEDEEDKDESSDNDPRPINTLNPGETVTLTAEMWEEEDHNSDKVEQYGILKDMTGMVDFIRFSEDAPTLLPETTYRIRNAKTDEYEGDLQVKILDNTKITRVQPGVGWTEAESAGEDEELIITPQKRILEELRENEGCTQDELVEKVDVEDEQAETAVENLLTNGVIMETSDGIRVV
ncbi:hypothetical protein ACEU6E_10905 (plasmid) [Halorutilales archaeon Cl-col2-1]